MVCGHKCLREKGRNGDNETWLRKTRSLRIEFGKRKVTFKFHPLSRSNMKSIKEAKERKFPSFRFEKGQGQSVFKDELHVSLNNQAPMDLSCASCAAVHRRPQEDKVFPHACSLA